MTGDATIANVRLNGKGARHLLTIAAVLLSVAPACSGSSAAPVSRTLTLAGRPLANCELTTGGGGVVGAKCGSLSTPENPAMPGGRNIDLRVAVLPATGTSHLLEPVFFIAGGPGASTVSSWARAASIFPGLNDHHDIVLVDQRGTGGSNELVLPPPDPGEAPAAYAARAIASLDGDPRYYTTAVAMDDLDAVRRAMGYDKIDLYGGSYGATAVQYFLRQHGDHVRAAVLDGGTLVEVPVFELIAANSQLALDDVLNRCLADSGCAAAYPDVRTEFTAVLTRLTENPVTTDVLDPSGDPIVMTADAFAGTIHQRLVESDAADVPWLIHAAWSGHMNQAASFLARDLGPSAHLVMSTEIICSEAWARDDPDQVKATGGGSYMLSNEITFAESNLEACMHTPSGYVRADDAQPVETIAPVLLLNGSNDPQDPPGNVAAATKQMPNSLLVVAPGLGHTVGHIGCLPQVVVRFFDSGKPDAAVARDCIATMQPAHFRLS